MSFSAVFGRKRQVIPRWHPYALARWLGVNTSINEKPLTIAPSQAYREIVQSWESSNGVGYAADLVGNALVLNYYDDPSAQAAARFILENESRVTQPLLDLATNFIRLGSKGGLPLPDIIVPGMTSSFYRVIANLKAKTRDYPRNPILWMDLAFYYSSIGQTEAAENAVIVALSLNSDNRYLLRSGARFFMHIGDAKTALTFLKKSTLAKNDPWVLAAEIAISDTLDAPIRSIKAARNLVINESIPKFHLSELASALGTIELKNGAKKKGRQLFKLALEQPTENALAQASFLNSMFGEPVQVMNSDHFSQAFEAQARQKFFSQDFQGALDAAQKWFAYQPFSSRPAVMGSYIAGVALGQFEEAIKIAKLGQLASPDEVMLKNNLAFSLASTGKVSEAREVLNSISYSNISESEKYVVTATRGTVEFRSQNTDEGRLLYTSAIDYFRRQKDFRSETLATYFLAREEEIIKSPLARDLKEKVLKVADSLNLHELAFYEAVPTKNPSSP